MRYITCLLMLVASACNQSTAPVPFDPNHITLNGGAWPLDSVVWRADTVRAFSTWHGAPPTNQVRFDTLTIRPDTAMYSQGDRRYPFSRGTFTITAHQADFDCMFRFALDTFHFTGHLQ